MNAKQTSPLAIASLAFSCLGALSLGILAIPGIICGLLAKDQIRRGDYSGNSMAMAQAGVLVGAIVLFVWIFITGVVTSTLAGLFGRKGFFSVMGDHPELAIAVAGMLFLVALFPFVFTGLAKRRDSRSLRKVVAENQMRG